MTGYFTETLNELLFREIFLRTKMALGSIKLTASVV
jgi:hypothetical protein